MDRAEKNSNKDIVQVNIVDDDNSNMNDDWCEAPGEYETRQEQTSPNTEEYYAEM